MKKRSKMVLILAAVLLFALSFAAFATVQQNGFVQMFSWKSPETHTTLLNEPALQAIQSIGQTYEGSAVHFTLDKALYDQNGQTLALGWTLDPQPPLAEGEKLYVLCDDIRVDGDWFQIRSMIFVDEFFLTDQTPCTLSGVMPDNDGNQLSMTFSVLRTSAEIVHIQNTGDTEADMTRKQEILDAGKLPVTGGQYIEVPIWEDRVYDSWDQDYYLQDLLSTGLMELVDHFTIQTDIGNLQAELPERTLNTPVTVDFGAGPITITQCTATPTRTTLSLETYIPYDYGTPAPLFTVLLCADGNVFASVAAWPPQMSNVQTLDITPTMLFPDTVILVPTLDFDEHANFLWDESTAIVLPLS